VALISSGCEDDAYRIPSGDYFVTNVTAPELEVDESINDIVLTVDRGALLVTFTMADGVEVSSDVILREYGDYCTMCDCMNLEAMDI
jgi:hypothetical protein